MLNVFNIHKTINYIQAKRTFKKLYNDMSNSIIQFNIVKLCLAINKLEPKEQVSVLAKSGLNQDQILFVMINANYDLTIDEIRQILKNI